MADSSYVPGTRPGRNEPCYCGSGKKYKRCHLDLDREAEHALAEALPEIRATQARANELHHRLRDEYAVFIEFVPPVQWQERKVWAIGSRVYTNRPPRETFHEFLVSVLRSEYGEAWRATQSELPRDQQHFLLKCSDEWDRFKRENAREVDEDGLFSAIANGFVQFLINHAWDLVTLIQAAELPSRLLDRLRARDQFQGARYEVAIAALLARLGCAIQFIDDVQERQFKHPEFIATHRGTDFQVAVEAKSRHREGVINVAGDFDNKTIVRGDVHRLFTRALQKETGGLPYLIFIDVNAPPALTTGFENQWQTDVRKWMQESNSRDATTPDSYGGLAVTNLSPHYDGNDLAQGSEWSYFRSGNPAAPMTDEFARLLRHGLDRYHRVPNLLEGGQLRE